MAATPPPASVPPPVDVPKRGDRTTFSDRLDAFISWFGPGFTNLAAMVANAYANAQTAFSSAGAASGFADNAQGSASLANDHRIAAGNNATAAALSAASAINAPGTSATSTTSLTIGPGLQTLTLAQTGKSFTPGQTVVIPSIASPGNQMTGVIEAFNAGTGAMTVNVSSVLGAGTFASWAVALSGKKGDAGTVVNPIAIGSLIAMNQTANLVTQNGCDYLKTGVLASAASYTSAPLQNIFSDTTKPIPAGNFDSVASGGGITVAISNNSATSQISYDNGYTWSPITLPSAGYRAVTYGASLFVAVGASVCATSSDGVNWDARTIGAQNWNAVIHDGVNYVAVSGAGTVGTYSADGINWATSTLPVSANWASLCFAPGLILATPNNTISNVAASSADHGQTWALRTLPQSFNQYAKNCTYGAGLFVVHAHDNGGGSTNTIFTTSDCITWATKNLGVTYSNTKTMNFVAGVFVLTKAGTKTCYTSTDGANWVAKTTSATHNITSSCVVGGRLIGVGGSGVNTVDVINAAYGRGYHIALFADMQNQSMPLYMRMS